MQKQNEPTSEGGGWLSSTYQSLGYGSSGSNGGTDSPGKKEGGGRREKLASYIRAANEIRQSYYPSRNTTAPGVSRWNAAYEDSAYETPSNQELMEYVANGKEEIMLFPTYGRTGIKEFRRDSGESEPVLKSAEVPVVEVNVRGWIYTPHTALPPSRKNRFAMAAVAKLCGVPNIDGSQDNTSASEEILGAARVVEVPDSSTSSNENSGAGSKLAWIASKYGLHGQTPTQQSPSTPPPTDVRELSNALRTRLSPFLTTPSFHMPLTVFFYNPKTAQSTTTRTDSLGHFAIRKSLPFTPTHIRVLAGENLCAEDRISYIDAGTGISLISDIDDTIKVSGIGTGLREMFRNVFIREISTMPVPGVAEWFRELSQPPLNVQIHYLSNSPWQLFPFLKELLVGHMNLPLGTWHLKKYSGFIQGIFEPVIERKKESLEGLLTSFPGRKWILVGDGGEGDLEAYTDVVKRWPGHVIAVYIRDVSGIGEEVVGPGAGAHSNTTEYFDGNTSRDGLNSLNFGKWAPEEAQKAPSEHLIDLHSHSLSRSGSDLSGRFGNIGPEIHPANRASTWGGDFSTAVKKTPGDPVKFTPPPVPSKPRELRGTPITSPATDGSDKGNIIRHSSASQKIDSYESLPGASEPTVAMHDGGKYRPSSATPPSIHLGRGTGTSSSTSSIKYGSPPAHVPSNYSSTVSLPPLQSTTSQQISANSSQRPLDKKAELWKKRWEYASELLAEQGVVLRSWKVGHDVHAESVDLVKGLLNEQNRGTNNPEK